MLIPKKTEKEISHEMALRLSRLGSQFDPQRVLRRPSLGNGVAGSTRQESNRRPLDAKRAPNKQKTNFAGVINKKTINCKMADG
jgi:hypothetical protein